jgi:hypothetical protein
MVFIYFVFVTLNWVALCSYNFCSFIKNGQFCEQDRFISRLKTVFMCSEIQPVQGEDAKREESPESLGQARPFPVAE